MDEVISIIWKELNINGNICELLETYFKLLNKHEKHYAEVFNSKYDDYRDTNQKEETDYINKNFTMLPIHKELSKLNSNKTQMDYDATSLYPSAM